MHTFQSLDTYLDNWADSRSDRFAIAQTLRALVAGCINIGACVARASLDGDNSKIVSDNADGDAQRGLDILANDILIDQLRKLPVAQIISEELVEPMIGDPEASLIVALDPLDGSTNIDTNVSIGTIFAIYSPCDEQPAAKMDCGRLKGANQRAAGYVIYGPATMLVLSCGAGTHIFTLKPNTQGFVLTSSYVQIPQEAREFAVNLSNYRHWDEHIRTYIDDCLDGDRGVRRKNYNMRWIASLVAECHRILMRGGIFLYPGDRRTGYREGRLRLLYEANPIAFLVEQAGGGATTGHKRILDVTPKEIHQRVPLIFGSLNETGRVDRYYAELHHTGLRSPLFDYRGLFRN